MSTSDELRKIFSQYDINKDGKICSTELGAMLRSLGQKVTDEEIKLIISEADKDGDGLISLEEFIELNLLKNNDNEAEKEKELRMAFQVFDTNGDGLISAEELHSVLKGMGGNYGSVEDCKRMIAGVDSNGDGLVDFNEFKAMMGKKGA